MIKIKKNNTTIFLLNLLSKSHEVVQEEIYSRVLKLFPLDQNEKEVDQENQDMKMNFQKYMHKKETKQNSNQLPTLILIT